MVSLPVAPGGTLRVVSLPVEPGGMSISPPPAARSAASSIKAATSVSAKYASPSATRYFQESVKTFKLDTGADDFDTLRVEMTFEEHSECFHH